MRIRNTLPGACALAFAAALVVPTAKAADTMPGTSAAQPAQLKHYESQSNNFWKNPPPDWFLGDETEAQKGLTPVDGPPTGLSPEEIQATLKKIKLPSGFSITLYAAGVNSARQMAWGDKGTLFVGAFGVGNVYAITDEGKTVKTIISGLKMPTGLVFSKGTLYVADIDRILAYENAESLPAVAPASQAPAGQAADGKAPETKGPEGKVVYDDMPPYRAHGWKYLAMDKQGWLYVPFGVPCNICVPPTSTGQIRRVDPRTGAAELIAVGVRNSVGGDIDPRTGRYWFSENARDWLGDDKPSDKLNMVGRMPTNFGYPYCHQGNIPDPKLALGHKCSEFTPPVLRLGYHVAPLGMKFYTGNQFPEEYKNNIFLAEHGSWNRHKFQGARIMRITVDANGKNAKQTVFASGWLEGDKNYLGRPNDVVLAKDGSLMISDDWAGAIYRISYRKQVAGESAR